MEMQTGRAIYERLKEELSKAEIWNNPCPDYCVKCINCQFWAIVRKACGVRERMKTYTGDGGENHEIWT